MNWIIRTAGGISEGNTQNGNFRCAGGVPIRGCSGPVGECFAAGSQSKEGDKKYSNSSKHGD